MDFAAMVAILAFLIGLPWLILHYVTKWKTAPKMTGEDEQLLDEMYNLARRLEDRVNTVERIVAADNPDFRPGLSNATTDWQIENTSRNYSIDRRN